MRQVMKERGGKPPSDPQIKPLLAFSSLWIRSIVQLCRMQKVALVLGNDTTFFEKRRPSAIEKESELGKGFNAAQERQFAIHKQFVDDYSERRKSVAEALGVPLAGPGRTNDIGFIDEFHYDREGTRALCDDFATAIQTLL
jgi:hypothetical protein